MHTFASSTTNFEKAEYYFNAQVDVDRPFDRDRARHFYQKALQEGEENALLWYQLGRLDFLDGDFASAIERYNTQIELYDDTVPNVLRARVGLDLWVAITKSRKTCGLL